MSQVAVEDEVRKDEVRVARELVVQLADLRVELARVRHLGALFDRQKFPTFGLQVVKFGKKSRPDVGRTRVQYRLQDAADRFLRIPDDDLGAALERGVGLADPVEAHVVGKLGQVAAQLAEETDGALDEALEETLRLDRLALGRGPGDALHRGLGWRQGLDRGQGCLGLLIGLRDDRSGGLGGRRDRHAPAAPAVRQGGPGGLPGGQQGLTGRVPQGQP